MKRLLIASVALCLAAAAQAQQAGAPAPDRAGRPEIWMMPPGSPDGRCMRELFTQPDAWKETRAQVDVLAYADHVLDRQFTDDELRAWLPMLDKWGLKLGLEVGAVKPWGKTGRAVFETQRPKWDRFQSLGGRIYAVAMDEPLNCVRNHMKDKTDAYAVEETARFIALVRQHYPEIRIGDIEGYPSVSMTDLIAWIDALQTRLAQMNVRGLDFFRVDVDWVWIAQKGRGSWSEMKQLEEACRQRKIPFSMIYWAADYPALKHHGLADDATWYVGVMRHADDFAMAGGTPDQCVIESWVGAPSHAVPEIGDWTFTRSVLDFCRKYVPPRR